MKAATHPSSGLALLAVVVVALSGLLPGCSCKPVIEIKSRSAWNDNDNSVNLAVPTLSCDPATGRCWDLLPSLADARDNYIVEQNEFYDRAQPVHARAADQLAYATDDDGAAKSPANRVNPGNPRHAKKDMFMSRGWGAGGMPFSVLYMKSRTNHSSTSTGSSQVETNKNYESGKKSRVDSVHLSSTTGRSSQQPNGSNSSGDIHSSSSNSSGGGNNNRLAPRNNNGSGQPRRHYSIIPQLFISYGWGPSGK